MRSALSALISWTLACVCDHARRRAGRVHARVRDAAAILLRPARRRRRRRTTTRGRATATTAATTAADRDDGDARGTGSDERERLADAFARSAVASVDLAFESLRRRASFAEADACCFLGFLVACESVGAWALRARANAPNDALTPVLAAAGVVTACASLVGAYANRETTPSGERRVACVVGFAAWMASTFAVFLLPTTVVEFRHVESADAVNEALARGGATARVSTLHAGLAHAVVGALIAALTLSSAVRMTKSYLTATSIPEWAATHAGTSSTPRWRKFVLHTAFAAPLLTLVVSAPAMLAEPLRWSDQSARDAQSTSFIISGLCDVRVDATADASVLGRRIDRVVRSEGRNRPRTTHRTRALHRLEKARRDEPSRRKGFAPSRRTRAAVAFLRRRRLVVRLDERRVVDVLRIHRRRRALHQHRLLRVRVVRDHGRDHDRHVPAFDHLAMSLSGLREESSGL